MYVIDNDRCIQLLLEQALVNYYYPIIPSTKRPRRETGEAASWRRRSASICRMSLAVELELIVRTRDQDEGGLSGQLQPCCSCGLGAKLVSSRCTVPGGRIKSVARGDQRLMGLPELTELMGLTRLTGLTGLTWTASPVVVAIMAIAVLQRILGHCSLSPPSSSPSSSPHLSPTSPTSPISPMSPMKSNEVQSAHWHILVKIPSAMFGKVDSADASLNNNLQTCAASPG
jgi:hypothetical protein